MQNRLEGRYKVVAVSVAGGGAKKQDKLADKQSRAGCPRAPAHTDAQQKAQRSEQAGARS